MTGEEFKIVAASIAAVLVLVGFGWTAFTAFRMDMERVSEMYGDHPDLGYDEEPMYTEADMIQNKKNA